MKYRIRIACTRGMWLYLTAVDTSQVRFQNNGSGTRPVGKLKYWTTPRTKPCDPTGAGVFEQERAYYLVELLKSYRRFPSLEEVR